MDFEKIPRDISSARFQPYLVRCVGNKEKALGLYQVNIEVSQSFYTPLSVLEVTLRNKIDQSCINHFHEESWLKRELPPELLKQVLDIEIRLRQNNREPTNSRILAELNFGFWTSLFNRKYAKKFWKPIHRVFENIPKRERQRAEISSKLNHIRTFRNRIYHYEPIIWDLEVLNQRRAEIYQTLYWLNNEVSEWVKSFDTFQNMESKIKKTH